MLEVEFLHNVVLAGCVNEAIIQNTEDEVINYKYPVSALKCTSLINAASILRKAG